MEQREIDEQLKNLKFDMDAEIDDRNERLGHRHYAPRHVHQPVETSHAIVLAALIIVGGLWGGKLLYDYIQEQRIKAALSQAAQDSRRAQAELNQRIAAEAKAREQRRLEEQTQRQAELARLGQEKRFQSAQCQFWWQQHNQNPTERTALKKREACRI